MKVLGNTRQHHHKTFYDGICSYYTFWSGVADLSARYPRARAPEGEGG